MAEETQRFHAVVHGRVQGVSFRYFVLQTARPLGVTGWVCNRFNRTVEVTAEGTASQLEVLLKALQQGPPGSRVDKIIPQWQPATGEFSKFKIIMTR